ncbi:tRNA pseudouridine38-40 synthase [Nematocida homosporus]|uniref:tRNA pseudouridine38-40 synthase n=1 Tax=Nematocida homosporus TaxID=1912981 RepID=UPI00221ECD9E|nr:tRNA pseudouridine38-40 synthase [Nematocida homosporus]KAI5186829.1 tRNA pseudouridine38-40 synthase [Nematocida homosporus]
MGKKRVILLVGYNGRNYHGSQLNKDEKTVEKQICDEVAAAGYFHARNCEDYSKAGLQRASRTDKGVHAAMLLLSFKIETGSDRSTDKLKNILKSALSPHDIVVHDLLETTKGFEAKNKCDSRVYEYFVPKGVYLGPDESETVQEQKEEVFRHLLSQMQGTHDFHNFTLLNQEKGTSRFIKSITVTDFSLAGRSWHRLTIHGQSFMIHQIRKMVGFALLVARHMTDLKAAEQALSLAFAKPRRNIPKAPAALLLLSHGLFTNYNARYGSTHGEINPSIAESYKEEVLYPLICTQEHAALFNDWYECLAAHPEEFTYATTPNHSE